MGCDGDARTTKAAAMAATCSGREALGLRGYDVLASHPVRRCMAFLKSGQTEVQ